MDQSKVSIFWFRRDLRLEDNTGLSSALQGDHPVLPIFIFDTEILGHLEDKDDRRVTFIHDTLTRMDTTLREKGSALHVFKGKPLDIWRRILKSHDIAAVYFNRDYEPYAEERDQDVIALLQKHGVKTQSYKDQVIFENLEVAKDNGEPYTVYTPYSKKWKKTLDPRMLRAQACGKFFGNFVSGSHTSIPSLEEIGFVRSNAEFPSTRVDNKVLARYAQDRNTPAIRGTTHLGLHLRFGTVSIRKLVEVASSLSETWLNELIWREFFMQILANFPHVVESPFRPEYAGIEWRHDEEGLAAWCEGRTGYPIVDAGMRELNATGFMHNRVRMIAASFLVKHLLIDYRWGEAYFARRLLDFDLAANNGNWQWVVGSGCDAAPYFRIFNPELQTKKFDPDLRYIKHWVPEYGTHGYPDPIINHEFARQRTLATYKKGLAR